MLNDFVHSKISMNYLSRLIDEYKGKETVTKIEEKTVFLSQTIRRDIHVYPDELKIVEMANRGSIARKKSNKIHRIIFIFLSTFCSKYRPVACGVAIR